MSQVVVRRSDLVEPELSYSIIGCAYDVYNELDILKNIIRGRSQFYLKTGISDLKSRFIIR